MAPRGAIFLFILYSLFLTCPRFSFSLIYETKDCKQYYTYSRDGNIPDNPLCSLCRGKDICGTPRGYPR